MTSSEVYFRKAIMVWTEKQGQGGGVGNTWGHGGQVEVQTGSRRL